MSKVEASDKATVLLARFEAELCGRSVNRLQEPGIKLHGDGSRICSACKIQRRKNLDVKEILRRSLVRLQLWTCWARFCAWIAIAEMSREAHVVECCLGCL